MCKPPVGLGAKRILTLLFSIVFYSFAKIMVYLNADQRNQPPPVKKSGLLTVLLFLFLGLYSQVQDDSLIICFNRNTPADISTGERLLKGFSAADSARVLKIASRLNRKESKVSFYHAVG